MYWLGEMRLQSTEFACVVRLASCYIATHVNGETKTFISEHPETDIKVAQVAAKGFAEARNIPYHDILLYPDQPIITVLKHEEKWFPAELHAEKIRLLTKFRSLDLGRDQQEAINIANFIALIRGADSIPSIGISLDK